MKKYKRLKRELIQQRIENKKSRNRLYKLICEMQSTITILTTEPCKTVANFCSIGKQPEKEIPPEKDFKWHDTNEKPKDSERLEITYISDENAIFTCDATFKHGMYYVDNTTIMSAYSIIRWRYVK